MSARFKRLAAALSLSLCGAFYVWGGLALAAEKKRDPAQAAAEDPRSGAALNLEAAKRARLAATPGPRIAPRRIHHSAVNNPAADATAQDTQSETTIIDLGGGNLVAGFNDSGSWDGIFGGGNDHFTGYAFSTDGGRSWTDKGTLPNSAGGDAGDPVLAFDKVSGAVYFSTLEFSNLVNIQVFKSTDGGQNFGAPVNGTPGVGDQQDKEWMTVDNFTGANQGNVYLCWTRFLAGSAQILFTRSIDDGATFTPSGGTLLSPGGQGCFVVVSKNHHVHVFYYRGTNAPFGNGGDNKLFTRKSVDGGVSFNAEVEVVDLVTTTINGNLTLNGGLRSNSFPHAFPNPTKGSHLYAVFNDDPDIGDPADNGDIFYSRSSDGGATWSAPKRVNDDTAGDQFFPTVAMTDDGKRLMISYYSRSHDPSNLMFHRRARIANVASNGNLSFNRSFQLSPDTPIAIGQDPVVNTTYMGDYDQIAGGPNTFSGTWSDNRLPNSFHNHQPDVRFARVNKPANANLALTATPSPATIDLGQNSVIKINAAATGGNAADVFLSFPFVPGLKTESVNVGSGTCDVINGIAGCYLGHIADGTSKSVEVVVTGANGPGTRTFTAKGTTSSRDTAFGNNTASADVKVKKGAAVTKTYSTGNVAIPLPDLTTTDIPLSVPQEGTAVKVVAQIRLNHTWDEDLDISLVSPTGKVIDLSSDNGGNGDNYGSGANDCTGVRTVFTDLAAISITAGAPPFAGQFRPEQPLSDLVGEPTDGVWKLRIFDDVAADAGTLGCFKLVVTRVP